VECSREKRKEKGEKAFLLILEKERGGGKNHYKTFLIFILELSHRKEELRGEKKRERGKRKLFFFLFPGRRREEKDGFNLYI